MRLLYSVRPMVPKTHKPQRAFVVHLVRLLWTLPMRDVSEHSWTVLKTGVSTAVTLRQLLQQCLGLLEVGGVKALREPTIDVTTWVNSAS